ncbi:hypothetical protein ES703_83727 [subsurface metagenome]
MVHMRMAIDYAHFSSPISCIFCTVTRICSLFYPFDWPASRGAGDGTRTHDVLAGKIVKSDIETPPNKSIITLFDMKEP